MHRRTCKVFHPSLYINEISLVINIFSIICLSISYVFDCVCLWQKYDCNKVFYPPKIKSPSINKWLEETTVLVWRCRGKFQPFYQYYVWHSPLSKAWHLCKFRVLYLSYNLTFLSSYCFPIAFICLFHDDYSPPPLLHIRIFSLSLFFHSSVPFIPSSPSLLS